MSTLHEIKEKKWTCKKVYICNIMEEVVDDAGIQCIMRDRFNSMTRQGPDCSDCDIYKKWKEQREGKIMERI